MEQLIVSVVLAWLGTMFGSFAGAQVWRLRAKQLVEDKLRGDPVDSHELKRLKGLLRPAISDRSECLHCHHALAWYDLVPLASWAALRGRCRYCSHSIGHMEPLMELGVAVVFVTSYLAWPQQLTSPLSIAAIAMWLIACALMAILFAYDAKWFLLPFSINIVLIVVGVVFFALFVLSGGSAGVPLWSTLLALGIVAGLYYLFSLMGWSGLGDSILGISLALFLVEWQLAFLAVFLANLLGCILIIPLALQGKLHRKLHIPFGPFLILGTVIAVLWGDSLIQFGMQASDVLITQLML